TVPIDKVIAVYARENGQGMAFDVPRDAPAVADTASADNDGAKTLPGPTPMALVPVRSPVTVADNNEPSDPPPPPRRGDRPKLTRIK
ncbi:MAG: ClpXP protease specificity-enhancing factor SspB, partial [Burkholderiaceae bacterium]